MKNMNHLRDLLKHDIKDLYSAETQIIEAMPAMIEAANNPQLKQALEQHLRQTEMQRDRLDRALNIMGDDNDDDGGIFSSLFSKGVKCHGMEGLIDEGEEVMAFDMDPDVKDAAIICAAQKIEHYEIAGYGTARTYAEQLGLMEVAQLLQQTLIEEHDTNNLLNSLAMGGINQRAETGATTGSSDYDGTTNYR